MIATSKLIDSKVFKFEKLFDSNSVTKLVPFFKIVTGHYSRLIKKHFYKVETLSLF